MEKKWLFSSHHDHQQRVVIVVMLLNDGHTHTQQVTIPIIKMINEWLTIDDDDGDVDNRFEMMIIFFLF